MSSQSGNVSEMLAVSEGVALIPIATLAFSNLPFIKYDKEDVITLSDDEEVHYYSYQNQVDVINQAQETSKTLQLLAILMTYNLKQIHFETDSQKRQREPDVDSDDTLSSTDQLNSNFSKKSRASDENVYVNRGLSNILSLAL